MLIRKTAPEKDQTHDRQNPTLGYSRHEPVNALHKQNDGRDETNPSCEIKCGVLHGPFPRVSVFAASSEALMTQGLAIWLPILAISFANRL